MNDFAIARTLANTYAYACKHARIHTLTHIHTHAHKNTHTHTHTHINIPIPYMDAYAWNVFYRKQSGLPGIECHGAGPWPRKYKKPW